MIGRVEMGQVDNVSALTARALTNQLAIIDISDFEIAEKQAMIAEQIAQAAIERGFFYLSRVPADLLGQAETLFNQLQHFFAAPLSVKQSLAWSSVSSNQGYIAIEQESLDPRQPPDLKEALNVRPHFVPQTATEQNLLAAWPAQLSEFRQHLIDFYDLANQLAMQVLESFAIALSLPADFFTQHHRRQQQHTLRCLHYPPLGHSLEQLLPGQLRAGEHTDYGSITLLFQRDIGGLEVQNAQGDWIAAPPIPDTVLVNIGDLLQRWTNDLLRSTPHRVRPTHHQVSRYSIALFCDPDPETWVTCIETGPSRGEGTGVSPRYEPIRADTYLASRLARTY
ncbi:MAG: 2OG-Fe(II) oxygenase family protein [Cyanobacteria bacterium P01_D01_bin.44]